MRTLGQDLRRRYVARLEDHVRSSFPEAVWDVPSENLQTHLDAVVERALGYGFRNENDVTYFVELSYFLGERFDSDPAHGWAGETLRDAGLSASEKVAALAHRLQPF